MTVDRFIVDRRLKPGEDAIQATQPGQLAVRDRDAGADAGGAQPLALQNHVVRPLQTMANLLSALREGDFAIRARGARRDDDSPLCRKRHDEDAEARPVLTLRRRSAKP